ncbi:MAG TPA: DUF541 domain-containing protein, partial [Chromatiales bacterium]|nr:DUF541 domain-containing protein [Chromatiales bacterium]
ATPDRALVNMGIEARDTDLSAARDRVVDVSSRFLALCRTLGIDDRYIQTTGLTMHPEYRWDPKHQQRQLQGYLVQRQLSVDLRDLALLGQLIEGAVDAGVNQVNPPVLDTSRRKELRRQALAAAARDARSNAQAIANALGVSVGNVVRIDAQRLSSPPRPMMMRAEAAVADSAAASYQAGDIEIRAEVNAAFEIDND